MRTVFVPATPEQFAYDSDGNLTSDGRWTYNWDAENRLTDMTNHASLPAGARLKLDFAMITRAGGFRRSFRPDGRAYTRKAPTFSSMTAGTSSPNSALRTPLSALICGVRT